MTPDDTKMPAPHPDYLDAWVDEARLEYERRKQFRDDYRAHATGGGPIKQLSEKEKDIKIKEVFDEFLEYDRVYTEDELFKIVRDHGYDKMYADRSFKRGITTNRNAGRIVPVKGGYRRWTLKEQQAADKLAKEKAEKRKSKKPNR